MTALTEKAQKTRERIFETALRLFVERGYEQTTLRDIAGAANCSLGLTYRYFASKEVLVLTLYERLAEEMASEVRKLPPKSMADRFEYVMRTKLAQLDSYREAFGALFGASLNPKSGVAVLGGSTSGVRRTAEEAFVGVVSGATDVPKEPQARQMATVLYSLHLVLILFWLYDPTQGQGATRALLALTRDMLRMVRRLLRVPLFSKALERLVAIIEPVLGGNTADV